MKKLFVLLPAAVLAATPALAQDGPALTGRVEVRAGYDEVRTKLEIFNAAQTDRFSANDISPSIEAGVDFRPAESFLIGAYVGADASNIEECRGDLINTGDEACSRLKRGYTAGLRAGIPTGDGGLIYVKGGYSRNKIAGSYTYPSGANTLTLFDDRDTASGRHFGGGFELNLGRMFYTKGEYVHTRYNNVYDDVLVTPNNANVRRHQILIGVGIRLGAGN